MDPYTSTYILSRSSLSETLDDLCVRFILNIPEEELNSIERLSFQIEAAQWYFEDFLRDINPTLPTLNLRSFISKIFAVLPLPVIAGLPAGGAENAFINFMSYKTRVPVRGAIILNPTMDKLLLVKGYKKGASWSYPRGKINKDEDDMVCAIREVFEETGFDCNGLAKEEDYVEIVMRDQNLRLYIVPGVSEDTVFECQTRKEISDIKWHRLTDLPAYSKKKNGQQPPQNEVRTGKYYMVAPFLKDLRKWITTKGKKWLQDQQQQNLAAAANRIAEETEVEEELASPAHVDSSAHPRNFLNIPSPGEPAVANGYSGNDEASQRLKNMLLFGSQADQQAQQVEQSARLMNILGASPSNKEQSRPQAGVPLNVAQLEPNPRALLSMLQGGSGVPVPQVAQVNNQRLASPQTPSRAPPPIKNYTVSPQSPQSHQRKQPQNLGGIGSNAGWPQFPRNVPESTTHLPSPPPPPQTSSYTPSQPAQYNPPQNQIYPPPQQPAFSPINQNGFKPPENQQPQQLQPTPLDPFIPVAAPTKTPNAGQAGTLLSILKGATPVAQKNTGNVPPPAAVVLPAPIHGKPQTPTPILQKPPIPKGPKAHTQQQATLLAALRSGSPRASTVAPGSQAFTPPPQQPAFAPSSRPSTVGPQFRASPAAPGPSSQYVPPKQTGTAFDRRESISNQQQQTLLAMFRTGSVPPADEAVMSSPEGSPARPVTGAGRRNRSMSRGKTARKDKGEALKSPLGRERDGLMAYLEGVAKMGGQ